MVLVDTIPYVKCHVSFNKACQIDLSPTSGHVAAHVAFLTSLYYDVTIAQLFDGPFDCDVTIKKSANTGAMPGLW